MYKELSIIVGEEVAQKITKYNTSAKKSLLNTKFKDERVSALQSIIKKVIDEIKSEVTTIRSTSDIVDLCTDMKYMPYEVIRIIALDVNLNVIASSNVAEGGLTSATADNRRIFKFLLETSASRFIMVHNHPSGATSPSDSDIKTTKKIKAASQVMHLDFVDHVIVGEYGCYSFKKEGKL